MATYDIVNHMKKVNVPYFVAEPNEIIFTDYKLGKIQQKQLKLRNTSILPIVIEKLDIYPKQIFQIKINKQDRKSQLIAPGLCIVIFITFLPKSLEEIQGFISIKVHEGEETKIKVATCRKHPILTSHTLDKYHLQAHAGNTFDFGKCLVGSRVILEKNIKNISGNGKFVLINKNFLWNEIKKEELFYENNSLNTGAFSIKPATFSVEEKSEINFMCEFFPVNSGVHIENIVVTCDSCDYQILTLTGEAFTYEPKMVHIKDSNKLLDLSPEENSEKLYFMDMGKMLPFMTSSKRIEVINNSNILFNYSWVSIKDSCATKTEILLIDSSEISWSIQPNRGELKRKINDHSLDINMNDCPFGTFRHFFGLILEGVPLLSLTSDEISKMKTALGSLEAQQEGLVNLLVEKIEVCVECVPLNLGIDPAIILQPTFMRCGQPVVNEVSISNQNEIPVYYSWRTDTNIKEAEAYKPGGILLAAKLTPLESCIPAHSKHKLSIILEIKLCDDVVSNCIVSVTFIGRTWYIASSLSPEVDFHPESKHEKCRVIQGPLLKFMFLGKIADAKVKLCKKLVLEESFNHLIDFGSICENAVVQKNIFLQNASEQTFVCKLKFLKNEDNSGKFEIISNEPCSVFSVLPDLLVLDRNSHKEALLNFHPREEGSYCQLIAVSVNGSLPGPSWDFALMSGKVVPPSVVIYPSTSKDSPYEISKEWIGTFVPLQNISLRNESSHPSFLTAFHWGDPKLDEDSQLEVTIHPKSGMIRALESISFSMEVLIKSKKLKQFILPCFIGTSKDPLLVYFKCNVESPVISIYIPKDEIDEILYENEVLAMGLTEDDLTPMDKIIENEIWNVEFINGSAITFKGVSTYRVEVREFCIENKSPFAINYSCSLKNFAGKVEVQKFGNWKCPVEECYDDHLHLDVRQSRNTTVLELKPKKDSIGPWEKSTIEVWLLASTWGVYYDEITLKLYCEGWKGKQICLQPPSLKMHCISQVISHPLCFPAVINNEKSILRFGTFSCQHHEKQRTIYIRNTSCIDIVVIWNVHARLTNTHSQFFQLALHYFNNNIFKYIKKMTEKIEPKIYITKDNNTSEMLNQIESFIMKQIEVNCEDTSTEIAILPLIGPKNEDVFKVGHTVTIIPSHSERKLTITFNCGSYTQSNKDFLGTLVGYIHISPENRNASHLFTRPQGTKLNPLLLTLAANQTTPELTLRHDKEKSTMRLNSQKYFTENSQGVLASFTKSIIVENKSHGVTNIQVKVDEPLFITIKNKMDVGMKKTSQNVSEFIIQPEMVLEILVIYEIDRKELDCVVSFMKNLQNESSAQKLPVMLQSAVMTDNETVTIERKITISHDEHEMEVVFFLEKSVFLILRIYKHQIFP